MSGFSRRQFIGYGAAAGTVLFIGACSSSDSDGGSGGSSSASEGTRVQGPEIITDPSKFPTRFSERPEFADMVASGELPPVDERIGMDPIVLQPLDAIGAYGGSIRRGYTGNGDFRNAANFLAGPDSLLWWDGDHTTVIPWVARDFELSSDGRELTIQLRRGMRWSDGQPFTADDIIFWRDDINLNTNLSSGSNALTINGQPVTVEKVDDTTVRYLSPEPHTLLPAMMASFSDVGGLSSFLKTGGGGFAPQHYLSQFLPAYTSEAEANQRAADAGVTGGWAAYVKDRCTWESNPDLPTLSPWVLTRPINDAPWSFAPNPFSVWVDSDGGQLPYVGEVSLGLASDPEAITLSAVAGEIDFQDRHLDVASLPVLIENEERGGYTVHQALANDMEYVIRFNLAHTADPVIGDLIRNTDFRRALSLGIDRDQINETFFVGASTPSATLPPEDSPYFPGEDYRTMWAVHDIAQANELLDGIGLTEKDADGYRLRPDGGGRLRLELDAVVTFLDFAAIGDAVREQWADIGIEITVLTLQPNLAIERIQSGAVVMLGSGALTEDVFVAPDNLLPVVPSPTSGVMGFPYAQWYASGGARGVEPPPSLQVMKDTMEQFRSAFIAPEDERIEIGQEIYRQHVDQVWSAGVLGFGLSSYGVYIANNELRNVPTTVRNSNNQRMPSGTFPMTFFYDD